MEGQADAIAEAGWSDMIPMEIVMFADISLPDNTSDRDVWRFVQANRMILLTDNRSDNDKDN